MTAEKIAPIQVASCFIFEPDGRLLLLKRQDGNFGGGKWAPPGGTQEPGESMIETAFREVFEETGLLLEDLQFLGAHELHMPHGVVHMHTFESHAPAGSMVTVNPIEHADSRWRSIGELTTAPDIIWALPTALHDFGFIENVGVDPTLSDGSTANLLLLSCVSR